METEKKIPSIREQVRYAIKQTRAMSGMSRAEFADYHEVTYEVLANWEKGRTVPRADQFLKVLELRAKIVRANRKANPARAAA